MSGARVVVFAGLLLGSFSAFGAGAECFNYTMTQADHPYMEAQSYSGGNPAAHCASILSNPTKFPGTTHLVDDGSGFSGGYYACNAIIKRTSDNASVGSYGVLYAPTPIECPPDPCVEAMNLASEGVGAGANMEASGRLCASDDGYGGMYNGGLYGNGCEVIRDGAGISSGDGGHWYGQIKYTGQSCPSSDTPDTLQSDQNCLGIGGIKHCVSKTKKSCGSVNGQAVCLDNVPDGGCMLMAGGAAICDSATTDGPKDAMGDPLEPTSEVTETSGGTGTSTPGTTKTYNYYSSVVMEENTTTVPGVDGEDGEDGAEGGNEPGACEEGVDCDGEVPDDLEALDSFGELTQGFMDRVQASDLVSSVASLGAAVPTGACPDWDIEVFGQEISLSAPMCTIWGSVSGLLSAVMLIAWGLLAARIVLSA